MNMPSPREQHTRKEQRPDRSASFHSRKGASFLCFLLLLLALPVTMFLVNHQPILPMYAWSSAPQLQAGYPSGINHVSVIVMENHDWSQIKSNATLGSLH
jgi:hypothetical protein